MPFKGLDIAGQVCLIAGGTSGLGKAIAVAFASAGAKVVVGSTSEAKVEAMRKELGGEHDAVQLQVGDEKSVDAAVDYTVKKFGRLDAVVNAAGIIQKKPSLELSVEDFERIVRTNLTGSFIVAKSACRVMKNQAPGAHGHRGSIVFIASLNSYISLSEVLAYAASKSGVLGLVRGLANEWSRFGIRVNAIAPGLFPTDLNRNLIENTPRGDFMKEHTPAGRFGDAEELVGAAIYLISPAASFTAGQTIVVDGGFLARGVGFPPDTFRLPR